MMRMHGDILFDAADNSMPYFDVRHTGYAMPLRCRAERSPYFFCASAARLSPTADTRRHRTSCFGIAHFSPARYSPPSATRGRRSARGREPPFRQKAMRFRFRMLRGCCCFPRRCLPAATADEFMPCRNCFHILQTASRIRMPPSFRAHGHAVFDCNRREIHGRRR